MLSDFYRSDIWRDFRKVIISERLTESGETICEHCGKPIVKAYDIILHHIEHLTEDNYEDADVSVNPKKIMLLHHTCHNVIHNKLGYNNRCVWLVHGAPLSGKTTYVNGVLSAGDMVVDMDNIWQCVSGADRYVKDGRLNSVVFGVRDELLRMVRMRVGKWSNAYVVGGFPLISERQRLCKSLGARDIHIDTPLEVCLDRLNSSGDSRNKNEWEKYIFEYFEKYTSPTS